VMADKGMTTGMVPPTMNSYRMMYNGFVRI
jgi:hypothetical protein